MKKSKDELIEQRPYTLSELANKFQMDRKTMRKHILFLDEEIGQRVGRLYTPRQARIIAEHINGLLAMKEDA